MLDRLLLLTPAFQTYQKLGEIWFNENELNSKQHRSSKFDYIPYFKQSYRIRIKK